jgi:MFS family permease
MIQETGIPQERIGFYSGLIESVYSVTECLFLLFFWTDISDRYGRKPVMVICLAGLTLSSTLFGFSTHIWQMIATRAMAGVFSGCLGYAIANTLAEVILAECHCPLQYHARYARGDYHGR